MEKPIRFKWTKCMEKTTTFGRSMLTTIVNDRDAVCCCWIREKDALFYDNDESASLYLLHNYVAGISLNTFENANSFGDVKI